MKILKIVAVAIIVLLLIAAVVAPIGPLPGFFIGGTQTQPPESWPDTSQLHEIHLRVSDGMPRVVILWVIEQGGELFVLGDRQSGWVSKLGAGGPVDLRIDAATYALNAVRLDDGWDHVVSAYRAKYQPWYPEIVAGLPTGDAARRMIAVYRLER